MADPPSACHCGQCVLRSRLTNREVAELAAEVMWLRAVLGRIAAGHAHPSKLAGEAADESVARIPVRGQ